MSATATTAPTAPDRAAPADGTVEIVVAGAVRVRLIDATGPDRAAVEAQLGPAGPATSHPADITIRYVERLPVPPGLRLLGPGELAVAPDGLVVLRGRFRRPARVAVPLEDVGGRCELVCEHGVGRVPHLIAVINLTLPSHGAVALHASGVEHRGAAVVATGWSKGGKTEAVLALAERGSRLVGDEWLHLRPDGTVSGIREPVRVWDWHLAQLPDLRRRVDRRDRARLGGLRAAERAASARSARAATALARQRCVDLPQTLIAPVAPLPLPRGPVVLMTAAQGDAIEVRPTTGARIAARMVASLQRERADLRALADAHRFAHPDVVLSHLDHVASRERDLLHDLIGDAPACEVVHPYPVDLERLGDVLTSALERLS